MPKQMESPLLGNNENTFTHYDVTMLIKEPHPHAGELCHPVGKSEDSVTEHKFFGGEIYYEMVLENCPHLIERCFVQKDLLQLVSGGDWKRERRKLSKR